MADFENTNRFLLPSETAFSALGPADRARPARATRIAAALDDTSLTAAEFAIAKRELERQNAELQRARAEAEAKSLAARLAKQSADVIVAENEVAVWKQQLDDTVIRAPFPGIVTSKNAQPGEMISPLSAGGGFTRTGICTIVDMGSLEIEVDVNESYINRVAPGQPVAATLDAYPDWKLPAKVIAIIPTADRQKATVKVRVGFEKLDARILPDMGVKVAFQGGEKEAGAAAAEAAAGVLVPKAAVRPQGGRDYVWVVRNGRVERRTVTLGPARGDEFGVVAGVVTGERLMVEGPAGLADGAPVKEARR